MLKKSKEEMCEEYILKKHGTAKESLTASHTAEDYLAGYAHGKKDGYARAIDDLRSMAAADFCKSGHVPMGNFLTNCCWADWLKRKELK